MWRRDGQGGGVEEGVEERWLGEEEGGVGEEEGVRKRRRGWRVLTWFTSLACDCS